MRCGNLNKHGCGAWYQKNVEKTGDPQGNPQRYQKNVVSSKPAKFLAGTKRTYTA